MAAVLEFDGNESVTFEWPGWPLSTFTLTFVVKVADPGEASEWTLLRVNGDPEGAGTILTLTWGLGVPLVALDAAFLTQSAADPSLGAWGDEILLMITFDQAASPGPQAWAHWRNLTQDGAWHHEPLTGFGAYDPLAEEPGEIIIGDDSFHGSVGLVGIHGADLWAHDGEDPVGPLKDDPDWAGTADLLALDGWLFLRDLTTADAMELRERDLDGTDAECKGVTAALTGEIVEWAPFPGPDVGGWEQFWPREGEPDEGQRPIWKLHWPDPARWRVVDGVVEVTGQLALINPGLLAGYGHDVMFAQNVPGPSLGATYEVYPDRVFGLLEREWNPDTAQFVILWSGEIDPDPDPEDYNFSADHVMDHFPGVATRGLRVDFGGISWAAYAPPSPPSRVRFRRVAGEWAPVTRRRRVGDGWYPPAVVVVPLSADTLLSAASVLTAEGLRLS
jgi:hypothetical protein